MNNAQRGDSMAELAKGSHKNPAQYPCGHKVLPGWKECYYCSEDPGVREQYRTMVKHINAEEDALEVAMLAKDAADALVYDKEADLARIAANKAALEGWK